MLLKICVKKRILYLIFYKKESRKIDVQITICVMHMLSDFGKGMVVKMLFSTKGRYALRVMVELAAHNKEELTPLKHIAENQGISLKYLESIMVVLSKADYVISQHGKNGGYRLKKSPENYTVGEILTLLDGPTAPVDCLNKEGNDCPRANICPTLPMWKELDELIKNYLSNKSLLDLVSTEVGNNYII